VCCKLMAALLTATGFLCAGCGGLARTGGLAGPAETSSWDVVEKMWAAVLRDHDRGLKCLLVHRFYLEDWYTAAPGPSSRRAFHRISVSMDRRGAQQVFAVNTQLVQPVQDESLWPEWKGPVPFPFYFGVYFVEEEMLFDTHWRFLGSRQWQWSAEVPDESQGQNYKEIESLLAEKRRRGFYPVKITPSYAELRVDGDEVARIVDGKTEHRFPLDRTVPSWEALRLLFGVAGDVVKRARVTCQRMTTGERMTYTVTEREQETRETRGKSLREIQVYPTVKDTGAYGYLFDPPSGGMEEHNAVVICRFERTKREVFERALRKFLAEFRITSLTDKNGKAVDLPIGIRTAADASAPAAE